MRFPKSGLYALTQPADKSADSVIEDVAAALRGGAVAIQYRDKSTDKSAALALALKDLCHHYNAPLIVNDDIELAAAIHADGVHLGRADGSLAQARSLLGADKIIGISCYDDVSIAERMQRLGADYVAFGRFYPSGSKPSATPAAIETLRAAKRSIDLPIVVIGGITPDNAPPLLAAGADLVAAIGGVFNDDPERSARAYQLLF